MSAKEKIEKDRLESPSNESGLGDSGGATPKSGNQEQAELVVPPDGGWGWVVVVASFVCNVLVDGIVYSCGLLLPSISKAFDASEAQVAFVSSLLSGFYLIAGPFVSALANRYGFRIVTIIGAIITGACFALSYFANSVLYLFLIYGTLGGIGLSMIYIPAILTVGFYFERWRALATGVAMCGSGVGAFIIAPLTSALINNFEWRMTIVIHGAMILVTTICGVMFRPLKPVRVNVSNLEVSEKKEEDEKLSMLLKAQQKSDSGFVFPIEMQNKSSAHTWMGVAANDNYPTAEEVFRKSHTNLEMRRMSANAGAIKDSQGNGHTKPVKYIVVENGKDPNPENGENTVPLLNEDSNNGERRNTISGRQPRSRRGTLTNESQVSRPMYREDIFFGGSLKKIPQYQSRTSIAYHMSVTHLPTVEDVDEEIEAKCTICPVAARRTLATMLDFSLLKSPSFIMLALSGFFSMMGFFAPIIYGTQRAKENGMDIDTAKWIVSVLGIANTVGRIVCGVVSSLGIDALMINNIAITVGGLATIFSGISYTAGFQFAYYTVFGLSIACFASLRSIIVVELMGLEKLTNAFGLLMMFQGIAAIIGVPIAGFFKDYTQSYDVSFYIAGGLYTFSALLCYPLKIVKKWEDKKVEKKTDKKLSDVI